MKTSILLSFVAGIALAGPATAYAPDGASRPIHSQRTMHHKHIVAHAVALAPVAAFPAARPSPSFGDQETDGLSRNPDDCATYGCVDNGGG